MATNQQRREAAKRKLERQQQRRGERSDRRRKVAVFTAIGVVVVVVAVVVAIVTLGHRSGSPGDTAAAPPTSDTAAAPPPAAPPSNLAIPTQAAPPLKRPTAYPATVGCAYAPDGQAAKPVAPPPTSGVSAQGTATAALTTTAGQVGLTLDRALAPCTVNSFLSLARQGYFDNTPCHRLTTESGLQVLQCGDPSGTGSGGPGYKYNDETYPQLSYGRGYLAMANAGPNTNGSQFFMIYGDASALSPDYTVFGYIDPAGLQVLDRVAQAGSDGSLDPNPGGGKPNMKVTITKVAAS